MSVLVLRDATSGTGHVVHVRRLLVAGFTGRDTEAVAAHVHELVAMGVPAPETTPTLYRLDPGLVRQTAALVVSGSNTAGEVEAVIVVKGEEWLLTIGSDHTDRDVERQDIGLAKAATAKIVGTACVPLQLAEDRWDEIELRSTIGDDQHLYQHGSLSTLLPLGEILNRLGRAHDLVLGDGDVIFLGTVPVEGDIRPSSRFSGTLAVPEIPEIALAYDVIDVGLIGRRPQAKPELEFTDVDTVPWTPVEGGSPGQTERILSRDSATGLATRMLRFESGTDTTSVGEVRHAFWEEVYILDGELYDVTLGQSFVAGTYACRPPGMPHGPWRSERGCVTFEVRYPAV